MQKIKQRKLGIVKTRMHQFLVFSKPFKTNKVSPGIRRVFIPGCSLTGYNSTIVNEILSYLKMKYQDVDLLVQCCGQPTRDLGEEKAFVREIHKLQSFLHTNKIQQIIVGCESCYSVFKEHLPNVQVITLWEIINHNGIPEHLVEHYKGSPAYAIHDPCKTRAEKQIHQSIRNILGDAGLDIIEFEKCRNKTVCCGAIKMNHELQPELYKKLACSRADSAPTDNIVSYCQSCVNSLSIGGKNTMHVADFLFNKEVIDGKIMTQRKSGFLKAWFNRWKVLHY